jgi:hypothetical protein
MYQAFYLGIFEYSKGMASFGFGGIDLIVVVLQGLAECGMP